MRKLKLFLMVWMVVMIGTMVKPVFADVYDLDPVYEAGRSRLLRYQVEWALKEGAITEEEADLIFETDPLFAITNEQRKQICIEACKWALAKNLDLAKDSTIPLEHRQPFARSADLIKTTAGLKAAFNYDDVDLSLYNGDPFRMGQVRKGMGYCCGAWVHDCHFYGYLKVKEKEMRKAAEIWGYDFEEFVRRLSHHQVSGSWIISGGSYKTEPIPPGVSIGFSRIRKEDRGHAQLSLGKFGYSSNGKFCPDASKATAPGSGQTFDGWSLPLFENPISKTACRSSRGDEIWSGVVKGAQRGVFHLPKNRLSPEKLDELEELRRKPAEPKPEPRPEPEVILARLGIKVEEVEVEEGKKLVVTEVYPESVAEKINIKVGDIIFELGETIVLRRGTRTYSFRIQL